MAEIINVNSYTSRFGVDCLLFALMFCTVKLGPNGCCLLCLSVLDEDVVTAGVVLLHFKGYFQPHTVLIILIA